MEAKILMKVAQKIASFIKKLLKEENDEKNSRTKIICCIVAFSWIIIPVSAISLPGLLFKGILAAFGSAIEEKLEEYTESDELNDSQIYQQVKGVYIEYNNELDEEIANMVSDLEEEYTYTYTYTKPIVDKDEDGEIIYDSDGNIQCHEEVCTESIEPTITKEIYITKPEIQIVLAYVSTKYVDVQVETDTYEFDETEINEFLHSITVKTENITVGKDTEDGQPKQINVEVYVNIMQAEDVAKMYFTDDTEIQQYICSYESLGDIQDSEVLESYNNIDLSTFTIYGNGMDIPHYLQYDSRWANYSYGSSNIQHCGCGPTCLAMILSYYLERVVLPTEVVDWTRKQTKSYYDLNYGASWSIFPDVADAYGIQCTQIGVNTKSVVEALSNGKAIISSMRPGTFTKAGHFIVLRGITDDGKILVNDPNDNDYSKRFYEKEFSIQLILNESKGMWAFY